MASLIEYRQQLAERDLAMAWPQWRIIRLLGAGAFGEVYEIHREEYGRVSRCALKVIRKENTGSLPGEAYHNVSRGNTSDEFITTVLKEIDIMEKLKGAANIVVIDDYTVVRNPDSSAVLIRMELLTNLGEFMTTRQVTMNDILKMGIDICNALDYCEQQNIIHRDVKESNIFYSDQGDFKLGDFGISKQLNSYLLNNGTMTAAGTVSKMAPEIYNGQRYDNTVDIYSLGIVLYSLLNYGRPPFYPFYPEPVSAEAAYAADMQRLKGMAIPPLMGVDQKLNSIILKACSPKPSARFKTAEEFKRALQSYYAEINHLQWNDPYPASGGNKLYIYAAAIIAIIAIAAGSVSFWYLGRHTDGQHSPGTYEAEAEHSGYSPGEPVKPKDVAVSVPGTSLSDYLGTGDRMNENVPEDTDAPEIGPEDLLEPEAREPDLEEPDDFSGGGGHVTDAGNVQSMDDKSEGDSDKKDPRETEETEEGGAVILRGDNNRKAMKIEEPDWSNDRWVSDDKEAVSYSGSDRTLWVQYFDGTSSSPSSRTESERRVYDSNDSYDVETLTDVSETNVNGLSTYWFKAAFIFENGYYFVRYEGYTSDGKGLVMIELYTISSDGYIELTDEDYFDCLKLCSSLK